SLENPRFDSLFSVTQSSGISSLFKALFKSSTYFSFLILLTRYKIKHSDNGSLCDVCNSFIFSATILASSEKLSARKTVGSGHFLLFLCCVIIFFFVIFVAI